ncbi:MAG: hypothetical protein KAT06_07595 [Gammaproteobacteria bacterium]|nr:hypothetical protein [Gammaproteobacteria bacterium]
MKITEPPKQSTLYLFTGILIFLLSGTAALYYAIIVLLQLTSEIMSNSDVLTFDKGAFYLFGVGFGLFVFVLAIIYSKVVNNKLSDFIHRLIFFSLIGSVVLTFVLPQAIHFYIDSYTEQNNYQICRDQSHRWLHAVTIIYARNAQCSNK